MKAKLSQITQLLGTDSPRCDREVSVLLTDSRSLSSCRDTLFFALSTPLDDGHRYIKELYDRGVRCFVVERRPDDAPDDAEFICVPSPLKALQKICSSLPPRPAEMVAIAGSRGKTTIKEWLFQLLEPLYEIVRSPRSYNSRIGVPLSLWQIEDPAATALIEAGVSKTGEMDVIAGMIRPDTVIITNVGDAHADGFADKAQKAREKVSLAAGARTVVFCEDSPLVAEAVELLPTPEKIGWSRLNPGAPLFIEEEAPDSNGDTTIHYSWKGARHSLNLPFSGSHELENAAATLGYLLHKGLDHSVIAERMGNLHYIGTRMDVSDGVNSCSLVFDSYTSDYSSLAPALDFARRRLAGRRFTLILSDLCHEAASADACRDVARLVRDYGVDRFIGIGPDLSAAADYFPEGSIFFDDCATLQEKLSPADFNNELILFKGSHRQPLVRMFKSLEARSHETVLEVNLDSIVRNYNYFRRCLPASTGLIAMVKASAYGAGSVEVAKTLQSQGAAYLAVAVLDEGIALRQAGITMPIMVMNPRVANYREMFRHRLEPEIYGMTMLRDVVREAGKNGLKGYPVHIKLDTGMHRMGFIPDEFDNLVDILKGTDAVRCASMFSHLATADCPEMDDYTLLQLSRFQRYTDRLRKSLGDDVKRHVLNSAGIVRFPQYHYDFARLGIGLYGVNTLPASMEKPLAPVSTLRTVIISLRALKSGETVGYGRRGRLERDSVIATIPVGYADGMNRRFGNGAIKVLVNGRHAPTIGNICMDACMIDVTGIDCKEGDSVEIFGPRMPITRLSDAIGTIPYEILTGVSDRVKRVYYRE